MNTFLMLNVKMQTNQQSKANSLKQAFVSELSLNSISSQQSIDQAYMIRQNIQDLNFQHSLHLYLSQDLKVEVCNLDESPEIEKENHVILESTPKRAIRSLKWLPNDEGMFFTGDEKQISAIDTFTGETISKFAVNNYLSFSVSTHYPNPLILYPDRLGNPNMFVNFIDITSGSRFKISTNLKQIHSAMFLSGNPNLFVVNNDDTLQCYDLKMTKSPLYTINGSYYCGGSTDPVNDNFAINEEIGNCQYVRIINGFSGQEIFKCRSFSFNNVTSLASSTTFSRAIFGSFDNELKYADLLTGNMATIGEFGNASAVRTFALNRTYPSVLISNLAGNVACI